MSNDYRAADIEVLSGLEPVRRRPGHVHRHQRARITSRTRSSTTASTRRSSGHCKQHRRHAVYKDGSLEVADDGRGMPVDIHPKEKVSGVELILTRLHAGGKFSDKDYKFSGGLHGVGVSVVNALSKNLECWVRRGGKEYNIELREREGAVASSRSSARSARRNTGTTVRFWPDPKYFDSPEFSLPKLKHVLKAKAVLCPGLEIALRGREDRARRSAGSTPAGSSST